MNSEQQTPIIAMDNKPETRNQKPGALAVIILAAGKGTRMKSDLPKVLHPLRGKPLVQRVINTARKLNPAEIALVVGYRAKMVKDAIGDSVLYAKQTEQLGTGHAVTQAETALKGHRGDALVLYGDMPLLTERSLGQLVEMQAENSGPITMLTVIADNPRGFGRIVRDEQNQVIAIVEEAVCSPEQLAIKELNVGVYCFQTDWLWNNLPNIKASPKGEYYLTDLVEIAVQQGRKVRAVTSADLLETMGINTLEHLAEAEAALED
ncbi:MAG: hypothetical protein B6243_03805 [Anaerolineaceae bacterium 4572_5.2]|nr:MAG: hypothetical protein B6243_03805 [Anaerolineaceae bacterium 4572_5.2]